MDNNRLDQLLQDKRERQFWLKPVGLRGVDLLRQPEIFPESEVEIHFVDGIDNIADGDVLIVYRTGKAKLMFVAERLPRSQWTTPPENRPEENKRRYPYFFKAKNFTPEYGECYDKFDHRPFKLATKLNSDHQDEPARLAHLYWQKDRGPIPRWFAEHLIRLIRESKGRHL